MDHENKMFPVKVGWGWYITCLIHGVPQMLSWEIVPFVDLLWGERFAALNFIPFLTCLQRPNFNALQFCQPYRWRKPQKHSETCPCCLTDVLVLCLLKSRGNLCPGDWAYCSDDTPRPANAVLGNWTEGLASSGLSQLWGGFFKSLCFQTLRLFK